MSLIDALAVPVTVRNRQRAARDSHGMRGAVVYGPDVATRGVLQLEDSTEGGRDRSSTETLWRLTLPDPAVILRPLAQVIVNGVTYEVDGEPELVIGLMGAHHVEARVKKVGD